jgi:ribulose-bisphosphate carboxylase large chain
MAEAAIRVSYRIETAGDPEALAAKIASDQSTGTFTALPGETEAVRARCAARVEKVQPLEPADAPALPDPGGRGPWNRAEVVIAWPLEAIGTDIAALMTITVGGVFAVRGLTGLRVLDFELPVAWSCHPGPQFGIEGSRRLMGVPEGPMIASIIKPSLGLLPEETAAVVRTLCEAGVDFIKDDEVAANPSYAPLAERVPAVMACIRAYHERTGRIVTMAFNITDEVDAMRRHADLVEAEGGNCVMASMNWVGLSGLQALRRSTPLMIHGHRNGFGGWSRHPALGISFQPYQMLYRLTGVDHLHVHGIGGKFADDGEEVAAAARSCLLPLAGDDPRDRVMPVFSSGQWAGTLPHTFEATGSADFMFLAGGGILAHPSGPAAGVESLRQAWEAVASGRPLAGHAKLHPALADALSFFGER